MTIGKKQLIDDEPSKDEADVLSPNEEKLHMEIHLGKEKIYKLETELAKVKQELEKQKLQTNDATSKLNEAKQ